MNNLGSRMLKCQNLQVLTYEVRPQVFINFVFHSRPLLFFLLIILGRITIPLLNLIMTLITLVTNSSLSDRL
jgi:hypothetical protein